jgi:signal transduction histidine kinase
MIELLDGTITLCPVPGGGTRFTVALPHPDPTHPPS